MTGINNVFPKPLQSSMKKVPNIVNPLIRAGLPQKPVSQASAGEETIYLVYLAAASVKTIGLLVCLFLTKQYQISIGES